MQHIYSNMQSKYGFILLFINALSSTTCNYYIALNYFLKWMNSICFNKEFICIVVGEMLN